MVKIIPITYAHQHAAYDIWHYGMSNDLIRSIIEYYARQRRIWAILVLVFLFFTYTCHLFLGASIVCLYWLAIGLGSWLESYIYIKSRTDLFDGEKHTIVDNYGDKFLVAVMDERVVGTISYKQREDGEITFGGVKRPPCLAIYSLRFY